MRDQAKVRHQCLQRPAHLTQQADAGRTQRTVGIRQAGLGGGVAYDQAAHGDSKRGRGRPHYRRQRDL
nr:C287 [uncultured bacterium]